MTIAEQLAQAAENIPKVYEAGKKSEYDIFWDALQESGNLKQYQAKFRGSGWNDNTFKPKYSIRPTAAGNIFSECKITNLKKLLEKYNVEFDLSGIQYYQISQMFSDSTITDVGVLNMSTCTSLAYFLYRATKLVNVEKVILSDSGNTKFDNTVFQSCSSLEEIRFEGVIGQGGFNMQWSTKLSRESIKSIVNALSTTTDGLSITLSKTAVNNAFGIDADDAATFPEGSEYHSLISSRSNWTINCV